MTRSYFILLSLLLNFRSKIYSYLLGMFLVWLYLCIVAQHIDSCVASPRYRTFKKRAVTYILIW